MAKTTQANQKEDTNKRRADAFWNIFLPTENGKLKSTLIVNSFCYSIFCLAVYIGAYLLLLDPLDQAFAPHLPVWLTSCLESILPALCGTAVCCAFQFVFKQKKLIPAAYAWLVCYAIAGTIAILAGLDPETRKTAAHLMALVIPAPLITGCLAIAFLYKKQRSKQPKPGVPYEELPAWKRKKVKS